MRNFGSKTFNGRVGIAQLFCQGDFFLLEHRQSGVQLPNGRHVFESVIIEFEFFQVAEK